MILADSALLEDLFDSFLNFFLCHFVVFYLELFPERLGRHLQQVNKEEKFQVTYITAFI